MFHHHTQDYWTIIESSIECSSHVNFILFRILVEFKFITELDNMFKLDSFIFRANSSLIVHELISLFIYYIK
jgi:hypothetical protein